MTTNGATAYLWIYRVRPEFADAFRDAYGPAGEWARFFSRSPDFIRTDLFEGVGAPGRFATVDYFSAGEARPSLISGDGEAYEVLDRRWREATLEETFLGEFRLAAAG